MASRHALGLAFLAMLAMAAWPAPVEGAGIPSGLSPVFYKRKCPKFEGIVLSTVTRYVQANPEVAAMLLRLFFHDVSVNGMDASIMINDTATLSGEKDAIPNRSLNGFFVIDDIKAQLEVVCPGVVSCADILVLAVKDLVVLRGGPAFSVFLGRKDGLISDLALAKTNNPSPNLPIAGVKAVFSALGLGVRDTVALSGAHTLGKGACGATRTRFTNFNGTGLPDPSIPADLLAQMIANCSATGFRMDLDPFTPTFFDNKYFINLVNGRGIFESDQQLMADPITKAIVLAFARSQRAFFVQFAASMFTMSNIGVKTGTQGEIRQNCALVNSPAQPPAVPVTAPTSPAAATPTA